MPKTAFGNVPADGAKQFMPFASLKGYEQLVHKQEEQQAARPDPTEDDIERISHVLAALSKGDEVRIDFWQAGQHKTTTGFVRELVPAFQTITVGPLKLSFSDIYDIERL